MGAQGSTEKSIEIKNTNGPNSGYNREKSEKCAGDNRVEDNSQLLTDGDPPQTEAGDIDILKASINEEYSNWIKELDKENQGLTTQTKEKYTQQADLLRQRFKHVESNPRCVSELREVQRCYEMNPREPLNCADSVQLFKDCVQEAQASFKYEPCAAEGNS